MKPPRCACGKEAVVARNNVQALDMQGGARNAKAEVQEA